tara:strand:+ start:247 stop:1029 length:783 start_codon:yes stop_codon:yes gene_type:complete
MAANDTGTKAAGPVTAEAIQAAIEAALVDTGLTAEAAEAIAKPAGAKGQKAAAQAGAIAEAAALASRRDAMSKAIVQCVNDSAGPNNDNLEGLLQASVVFRGDDGPHVIWPKAKSNGEGKVQGTPAMAGTATRELWAWLLTHAKAAKLETATDEAGRLHFPGAADVQAFRVAPGADKVECYGVKADGSKRSIRPAQGLLQWAQANADKYGLVNVPKTLGKANDNTDATGRLRDEIVSAVTRRGVEVPEALGVTTGDEAEG